MLVINQPAFEVGFARFVVQQRLIGFCYLRFADGKPLKRLDVVRAGSVVRHSAHIKALSYGHVPGVEAVEAVSGHCRPVTG